MCLVQDVKGETCGRVMGGEMKVVPVDLHGLAALQAAIFLEHVRVGLGRVVGRLGKRFGGAGWGQTAVEAGGLYSVGEGR